MTGRREQDVRQAHGGSSRRRGMTASDSGFESLDSEGYYRRSPPANHATPLFTDDEQNNQWNSLSNLQQAYRDLWDKLEVATIKDSRAAEQIAKLTGDCKKSEEKSHKLGQQLDDADHKISSLKRENENLRKDNSALKHEIEELRREKAALQKDKAALQQDKAVLQQDKAQASQDLAHVKAQRDRYKNELEDARSTSSESTSSKHKRTTSSATKAEKPREQAREREPHRERERERERERGDKKERSPKDRKDRDREIAPHNSRDARDPIDSGVDHLRQRFDPSRTQQMASQSIAQPAQQVAMRPASRRMSTTIRPQVLATTYDGNYIPSGMGVTSPTVYGAVPRGGHPSVAVPTYATTYTSDGNYHPAPLPQNTQQ